MMVRLSPGLAGLVYEIAWDNFSVTGLAASCLGAFGQYWFFNQYCCEIVWNICHRQPITGLSLSNIIQKCNVSNVKLHTSLSSWHYLVTYAGQKRAVDEIRFHHSSSPVAQVFHCIRQALQSHHKKHSQPPSSILQKWKSIKWCLWILLGTKFPD